MVDQNTEDRYVPLEDISNDKSFEVIDSPLSEAAVLGFEYGYTLAEPNTLVMWEAQFGDFANSAQMIIDQFIVSGESKWLRMSGLVLLLPHGYEGQGPEHSSARLERFLQLCAEKNIQIVNCTTPANYFHVLRRQIHRSFRKPLVVFTPKSLLRNKQAVSSINEFTKDKFNTVIGEKTELATAKKIKKIILCSGKIYYDLMEQRKALEMSNIHIIRIEQLYPFPYDELKKIFKGYKNSKVIWCQEEPRNMGAWTFVAPFIESIMQDHNFLHKKPFYVGRRKAASPATGQLSKHLEEQKEILEKAIK